MKTGVHRRSQENVAMERAEDQLLDGTTNVQGIISIRYEYTYHYCLILITSIQIYKWRDFLSSMTCEFDGIS